MPGSGNRSCQQDSRISIAFSGDTIRTTCTDDDVNDRLRFQVEDFRQAFAYVVVNADDIILSIGFDNFINFDMLPPGTLRVYAFSTYGRITAGPGDVFSTATLSTPCFGLTENFVTIFNGQTGGSSASITTTTGETDFTVCPGDGIDDVITVIGSSDVDDITYVVTTDAGIVLDITTDTEFNFDGVDEGVCRIYAFAGLPPFMIGEDISDYEPTDCGGVLSDNFITVTRALLAGGTVATLEGETNLLVCPQDGNPDVFALTTSGNSGSGTRYLVTDENNVVISVPNGNTVNFDDAQPGTCRIWSVSFEGNLLATVGTDLDDDAVASGCSALSENFVTVVRRIPEAGTISTTDGDTELTTCPGDGNDDLITVTLTGNSVDPVAYVITDADGMILAVQEGPTFNVEGAGVGACRIYGVSYQGTLNTDVTGPVEEASFSDGCNDLTDNAVTVIREVPSGGTVATTDGETEVTVCPGDGIADLVSFTVTGNEGGQFTYLVTDENNEILVVLPGNSFDFDIAGLGVCRLWGLSYRGTLTATAGQNAATATLATDCFGLSENFVTVTRELLEGGTVATTEGETDLLICPQDGNPDVVTLMTTGNTGTNTRYLVTDEENVVIFIPANNVVDFNNAQPGICRIWSVSYEGSLIVGTGMDVDVTQVASGCFSISENFVEVVRRIPEAGTIATTDGETELTTCPGDGNDDLITVTLAGNSVDPVAYVITDADGMILAVQESPTFNVEGAGVGACRIYGVSYQGTLNTGVTGPVEEADFSDGCNDLTDNAVTVIREVPSGGTVTTTEGETEITRCPGDGISDVVTFMVTGNEGNQFTYLVTDENNEILVVLPGSSFDFEIAGLGVCRLWGLSYQGTLTAMAGQNAATATLATGCFGLSDNFVTVNRQQPAGGTIALDNGLTEATLCPGDGIADVVTFVSSGADGESTTFVVTNDQGIILSFPPTASINFETVDPGTCFVYTLAYTGSITAQPGDDINAVDLSDGCFSLSDNRVTIVRLQASTGEISLAGGGTEVTVCPGDFIPDAIDFDSTGTTLENFNYLVTDTSNRVIRVAFTDVINFETFPVGICRVYGLGYNGIIMTNPGEIAGEDQLASECSALSPNFVTVIKERPDGGEVTLADGTTNTVVCPMDGEPDLITVVSTGVEGTNFTYLLTTEDNVVIGTRDDGTFDFDNATLGSCRIWGLSYQGTLIAMVGDDAGSDQLASGCFDLSDNFVTVIREDVSGGTVEISGGGTEISTCPGDGTADLLFFETFDATGANFLFVATDTNNVILEVATDNNFDFEGAGVGTCRVWGLSFFGVLTAAVGDDADLVDLASGCFALSENFVTINRIDPVAGTIAFTEDPAADTLFACGNEPLTFDVSDDAAGTYDFAVTDAAGNLLGFTGRDGLDFSALATGTYSVTGVAYVGTLTSVVGTPFDPATAVEGCSDVSNVLVIDLEAVDGGMISVDGATTVYLCPENTTDGLLTFTTSSTLTGENYIYAITLNGTILDTTSATSYDFGNVPLVDVAVYAISYTGDLLMPITGRNVLVSELSTGCWDVSNAISVLNYSPEAGTVSVDNLGSDGIACTVNGDGNLSTTITGASLAGYAIVVTTLDSIVQLVSLDPDSIPFGDLPEGEYLVFGLSYTGNVTVMAGDDLRTAVLADNCFELTVLGARVTQGGTIDAGILENLNGTGDTITFCGPEEMNQLVIVGSTVTGPNYRYLITDETGDIVVPNLQSNIIPFSNLGDGTYRVYGYNFSGTSQAFFGRNVETDILASGCFALTNFLTVIKTDPDGGFVSDLTGATEVALEIPASGGAVVLEVMTDSDSLYQYRYIITDTQNIILGVVAFNNINFTPAGPGEYRIYGYEFTGDFIGESGDTLPRATLATDCSDLSDNFVAVTVTQEEGLNGEGTAGPGRGEINLVAAPNPATGSELTLRISSTDMLPNGDVSIRDINGQLQQLRRVENPGNRAELRFDVGTLSPGLYFLSYLTPTGNHTIRFIKQ